MIIVWESHDHHIQIFCLFVIWLSYHNRIIITRSSCDHIIINSILWQLDPSQIVFIYNHQVIIRCWLIRWSADLNYITIHMIPTWSSYDKLIVTKFSRWSLHYHKVIIAYKHWFCFLFVCWSIKIGSWSIMIIGGLSHDNRQ